MVLFNITYTLLNNMIIHKFICYLRESKVPVAQRQTG